ncbi:MAG TPA: response regulator [Candidatus Dormibacteraeota bacterium]
MHTYVDRLDHFLGDHHNEVIIGLALVVLAEAVIIWLWARRAATLRRRLDAALEAAGNAATHAAAALALDGLRPEERDRESTPAVSTTPARATTPAPAAAPTPVLQYSVASATPAEPAAAEAPPPAVTPAFTAPAEPLVAATPFEPVAAVPAPVVLPDPIPEPATLSPVDTAAALRAAAEVGRPAAAADGIAGWAVEAAAQLAPAPIEERPATGLGDVAAWTETRPLEDASPAWSWSDKTAAAAAAPAAPVPAGPDSGPDSAVNLLLVEDDINVAKLYRMLLESRGYTVRHAADGIEGLDAARKERPDLILLDVMMPRMNGISFLQALREDANLGAVPAVVLSNFREPRLVERAMALGALEYMVKAQTRPETLVGAIPHWLRGERVVTA